jgi:tetratricopeptide (TPR) repeat protein
MSLSALAVLALQLVPIVPPVEQKGRELAGGQAHAYRLEVGQGQAVRGTVLQRGIDVVVVLRGPDGQVAVEVDSPNGTDGEEPLIHIATASGEHVLEVRALEPGAAPGHYDLQLPALRTATTEDRAIAEALARHAEGLSQRNLALRKQGELQHAEANRLYAEARRAAERALQLRQQVLGPHSGDVAATHALLGLIEDEVGAYEAGKAHFEKALAIQVKVMGPDHPTTITTRSDLGYLALANGDWAEAVSLFTDASARREKLVGPDHVSIANGLSGLGEAYLRLGRPADAERVLRRAMAVREKVTGPDHASLGFLLPNLARAQIRSGRREEGQATCERAQAIVAKREHGGLHAAHVQGCLAEARLAGGDAAGAVPFLREAARIREAAGGPEHPWVAEGLTELGAALARTGARVEAEAILKRAVSIADQRLRAGHPQRQLAQDALARASRRASGS